MEHQDHFFTYFLSTYHIKLIYQHYLSCEVFRDTVCVVVFFSSCFCSAGEDETDLETFCARWEQLPQNSTITGMMTFAMNTDNDSGDADKSKTLHHKYDSPTSFFLDSSEIIFKQL